MDDVIPYGVPGFSLNAAYREVAAHYGLRARDLKHADGRRSEKFALARDALAWKLTTQAGLSPQRAANMMRVDKKTIREGVKRHAHRIDEHVTFIAREKQTDLEEDGASDVH